MRFFYVNDANLAVGPVDGAALEDLRRQGKVRDDSRVAREGESVWRLYADFFPPAGVPGVAPVPPPLPKPMAARVIGILNILFGVKGLFCTPFATLGDLFMAQSRHPGGTGFPWYGGWVVFHGVLGIFLAVALLISGIGLCLFRDWGRRVALVYAVLALGLAVGALAADLAHARGAVEGVSELGLELFQVLVGGIFGLVYPLVLLFMLRSAVLRDALQAND